MNWPFRHPCSCFGLLGFWYEFVTSNWLKSDSEKCPFRSPFFDMDFCASDMSSWPQKSFWINLFDLNSEPVKRSGFRNGLTLPPFLLWLICQYRALVQNLVCKKESCQVSSTQDLWGRVCWPLCTSLSCLGGKLLIGKSHPIGHWFPCWFPYLLFFSLPDGLSLFAAVETGNYPAPPI